MRAACTLAILLASRPALACSEDAGWLWPSMVETLLAADQVILARLEGSSRAGMAHASPRRLIRGSDPGGFELSDTEMAVCGLEMKLTIGQLAVLVHSGRGWERLVQQDWKDARSEQLASAAALIDSLHGLPPQQVEANLRQLGEANPGNELLASLIKEHLESPRSWMGFERLEHMYEALPQRQIQVIRAMRATEDQRVRSFLLALLRSCPADHFLNVELAAALEDLAASADAPGLFERSGTCHQVYLLYAADWLASSHEEDGMLEALAQMPAGYPIPAFFVRHPSNRARSLLNKRAAGDFARHDEETSALARMGDPGVLAWAAGQLEGGLSENEQLAVQVVAESPLEARQPVIARIRQRGGSALRWLEEWMRPVRMLGLTQVPGRRAP